MFVICFKASPLSTYLALADDELNAILLTSETIVGPTHRVQIILQLTHLPSLVLVLRGVVHSKTLVLGGGRML